VRTNEFPPRAGSARGGFDIVNEGSARLRKVGDRGRT